MSDAVKGLGIVNEAEIDLPVEFCTLFQNMPDVGNLVSSATTSAKSSLFCGKLSIKDRTKSFIDDV